MDFKGQATAETLFKFIMWLFGILGFALGWYLQTFYVTFFIALGGALLSAAIVVPDWKFFSKNPIIVNGKKL